MALSLFSHSLEVPVSEVQYRLRVDVVRCRHGVDEPVQQVHLEVEHLLIAEEVRHRNHVLGVHDAHVDGYLSRALSALFGLQARPTELRWYLLDSLRHQKGAMPCFSTIFA